MCKRCEGIDAKIAYYKQQLTSIDDKTAIALLTLVITDLESDKVALHPKDK